MKAKENHMWDSISEISCGQGRNAQEVPESNSLKLDSGLICLEISESKIHTNSGIQVISAFKLITTLFKLMESVGIYFRKFKLFSTEINLNNLYLFSGDGFKSKMLFM